MRNITVALKDVRLLREAKAFAARRGTSLSRLVQDYLTSMVDSARDDDRVAREALSMMRKGLSLGGRPLTRDAIHGRSPRG